MYIVLGRRGFSVYWDWGIEVIVECAFDGFAVSQESFGLGFFGVWVGGVQGWIGNQFVHCIFLQRWGPHLPLLTRRRGGSYVRGEKTGYGHPAGP